MRTVVSTGAMQWPYKRRKWGAIWQRMEEDIPCDRWWAIKSVSVSRRDVRCVVQHRLPRGIWAASAHRQGKLCASIYTVERKEWGAIWHRMGERTYLLTDKTSLGQWTIKSVSVSRMEVLTLSGTWTETSLRLRSGDGSLLLGQLWDTCIIDYRSFGNLEKCRQGCAVICTVEKGHMRDFLKADEGENIPFDWQSVFRVAGHQIGLGLSCVEVLKWTSLAGLALGYMHHRLQGLGVFLKSWYCEWSITHQLAASPAQWHPCQGMYGAVQNVSWGKGGLPSVAF